MTVNEKGLDAALSLMPKGRKMYLLACIMAGQMTRDEAVDLIKQAIDAYLRAASKDAEPVAWPGRKFCEVAERNIASLADFIQGADDKEVCRDAALAIRTLLAALTAIEPVAASHSLQKVQTSPDWILVPREPTNRMLMRAQTGQAARGFNPSDADELGNIFRAMLAAAPASPAPSPAGEDVLGELTHAFNEFSDGLSNDIQRVRNIRDGIYKLTDIDVSVLPDMVAWLETCNGLARKALRALSSKQRSEKE